MLSGVDQHFFLEALRDGWAVLGCEDGRAVHLPIAWLPYQAQEGDEIVVRCRRSLDSTSRELRMTAVRLRRAPSAAAMKREQVG